MSNTHAIAIKNKQGFSLLEVLIFISILSVFFVTAIAISVTSLRDMRVSQHRITATRAAEEMNEWLSSEKESDWNTFYIHVTTLPTLGGEYCAYFDVGTIKWTDYESCDPIVRGVVPLRMLDGIYTRKVIFTPPSTTTQITTTIDVEWKDDRVNYFVPISNLYTPWQ